MVDFSNPVNYIMVDLVIFDTPYYYNMQSFGYSEVSLRLTIATLLRILGRPVFSALF